MTIILVNDRRTRHGATGSRRPCGPDLRTPPQLPTAAGQTVGA
ncbi:MAG: hypothetical protein WBF75_19835 [Pseudonocardiaceae bacterium]